MQARIEYEETLAGLCYDALADMYYEKYSKHVSEEKIAIEQGFVLKNRLSLEDMQADYDNLKKRLYDDAISLEEQLINQYK